ncbi:helix-turn-helix transcriptional regulator [Asanoa sp. WMMD1127]|uniref:helix-turn-helix domain-containing protein n=1 Tax=Asanoa sp. WMMD1127 TaxID=3016107 RepID=UPI002416A254|nr:helix-turn-helix transcriptional regulator [Asanoa sp. WMMD1127]MDG4826011.1 helix-turn-helix transcriptional regulator [Asanoa sp. WMMD1127]
MREDPSVPRFSPPTPRSKRLGRELRRLREAAGMTGEQVADRISSSASRLSRIESGHIKPSSGGVMELLDLYAVTWKDGPGKALVDLARTLKETGWWARLGTLSNQYATYIAYEEEALALLNYEPTIIPGLLQTRDYALAVSAVGRETDAAGIKQRVDARMTRQEVLTKREKPLRLHAIVSEAALRTEVGGPDLLADQLRHVVKMAARPNVTVQVLRFAAGAHLADRGGFAVLTFDTDESPLGYVETPAGELFLEGPREIARLTGVFDNLRELAMSPAESIKWIKGMADGQEPLDHV